MKFVINRDYNYSRTRGIILQREEDRLQNVKSELERLNELFNQFK